MARRGFWTGLISLLVVAVIGDWKADRAAAGAQRQAKSSNRLLTGKLVAVVSMPEGMDRWLIEDLRRWGRYRVTVDPEGADLVMRGYDPQKEPQFTIHRGIPQPKREKHEPPPVLSVSVIDWVSNEAIWQADILDRKPKQGDDGPAGPETRINARGLKPQELARELTARLQQYVAELERADRTK